MNILKGSIVINTVLHFLLQAPKSLTDKQKALLYAYAELEEDTPGQIHGVSYNRDGKKR